SRRFKKSLNQGGFTIKIYIRNNAVNGKANTARSTSKIPIHRSIRLAIVMVVSFPQNANAYALFRLSYY
ncbi:hypothetical protein C6A37_12960, partial [Desulfobacteraceae bacterium SEEP-SAG9]